MITIKNRYNEAKIFADAIDSAAEGLIQAFCSLPVSAGSRVRIMPDVHAGKGCVIGMTMTIGDTIVPGLIGVDIGCGVSVMKVTGKRLELQRLDKLIREKVPVGANVRSFPHRFASDIELDNLRCRRHIRQDKAYCSIGTLGGGNHFIEMGRGEDGEYRLIIHSGSCHLGAEVAKYYQDEAYRRSKGDVPYELAYASGDLMAAYIHDLGIVQEYARINRLAIADEICKGMKLSVVEMLDCPHNYIDTETMILRKGAVSAKQDELLVIPMNMRDGCLLARGKGNQEWNESAPHGAGRLMTRQTAKHSFTLSQYKKEMKGIYSTTVSHDTLDESPMAYKPMEDILSHISDTVEIIERIRPIYNMKAGDNI